MNQTIRSGNMFLLDRLVNISEFSAITDIHISEMSMVVMVNLPFSCPGIRLVVDYYCRLACYMASDFNKVEHPKDYDAVFVLKNLVEEIMMSDSEAKDFAAKIQEEYKVSGNDIYFVRMDWKSWVETLDDYEAAAAVHYFALKNGRGACLTLPPRDNREGRDMRDRSLYIELREDMR